MKIIKNILRLFGNKPKLKHTQSRFNPIHSLDDKYNYKRYVRIDRDGSSTERVFLNVPDISLREEIIAKHYLRYHVQNFKDEIIGINFTSRDSPWDFGVQLSDGSEFNIEITSIADNKWFFEKQKREERFEASTLEPQISLRNLIKMHQWFDGKEAERVIEDSKKNSKSKDELIDNPYFGETGRIYLSNTKEEKESLADLLKSAISNKNAKRHSEKDKTVLIIDNRTSRFEPAELWKAVDEAQSEILNTPFPEIYFYTGYYSDDDGNNAEYSFVALKIPEDMESKFHEKLEAESLTPDEDGIVYK